MQSRIVIIGSAERTPAFQQALLMHFPLVEALTISRHHSLAVDSQSLLKADGLIVTSALSLTALTDLSTLPPFYCVGQASADAVQKHGGHVVYTGKGSAEDMVAELINTGKANKAFVHLCGTASKTDWYSFVEKAGGSVSAVTCYEAIYEQSLSIAENPDYMVFLSEAALTNTQQIFINEKREFSNITAVCLSEEIAKQAKDWKKVLFASTPTKENLIHTLKQEITTPSSC